MYYYESVITGAVFITNGHHKSENMPDAVYLFKQKLVTSVKLIDLIDVLRVLSIIKGVCRIFGVLLTIFEEWGVGRMQQLGWSSKLTLT